MSLVESFNQTRDFESDLGLNISFPQPFQTRLIQVRLTYFFIKFTAVAVLFAVILHRVNDNVFPVLLFSSFEVVRILSE